MPALMSNIGVAVGLQCRKTAQEFAAAVAAARAHTPRRDLSPMARAYASHGGRFDSACLDLSYVAHGQI